jgi:hypothetical protein
MNICNKLKLERLFALTFNYLRSNTQKENAVDIFLQSQQIPELKDLQEATFQYLVTFKGEIDEKELQKLDAPAMQALADSVPRNPLAMLMGRGILFSFVFISTNVSRGTKACKCEDTRYT